MHKVLRGYELIIGSLVHSRISSAVLHICFLIYSSVPICPSGVPDVSADGVNDGSSTNITINITYLDGGPAQKTVDINFVLLKQNSSNSNILLCEDQDTCDKDSSVRDDHTHIP